MGGVLMVGWRWVGVMSVIAEMPLSVGDGLMFVLNIRAAAKIPLDCCKSAPLRSDGVFCCGGGWTTLEFKRKGGGGGGVSWETEWQLFFSTTFTKFMQISSMITVVWRQSFKTKEVS